MGPRFLASFLPVLIASLFFAFQSADARILNVPEDWESIQVAINAAEEGDTVLVAPGQYVGGLELSGPPIVLASWILLDNDPAYIDSTIIEANMERSVLRIDGGQGQTSLIRGFTLRRGRLSYGGGVNCRPAVRPRLEDMVIRDCVATTQGGGIYLANSNGGTVAWLKRVKIINNEAEFGGAIGMLYSSIHLDSCEIVGNTATLNGSAIGTHRYRTITISRTLIAENITGVNNNPATIYDGVGDNSELFLDHVTMSENRRSDGRPSADIQLSVSTLRIANSVFWDSSTVNVTNTSENSYVDYCCFWRGRNAIGVNREIIGENIIDGNPRFINPERGDYRLSLGSSCIDAGNPDSTRDADGSPCDLGAFSFVNQFGWLEGRVSDRETNLPISGAELLIREGDYFKAQTTSDSAGLWRSQLHLPDGDARFSITAGAQLYHPIVLEDVGLNVDDTLWFALQLERVGLQIAPDSLIVVLNPGDSLSARFYIANTDRDSIIWSGALTSSDPIFERPGEIEDTLNAGEIVDDDRLQGVVFIDGTFFIAGSDGNEDWNTIYKLSKTGEFLGQFLQPDISRYGIKDMAWDGRLIWGAGPDSIYGFEPEGDPVVSFEPSIAASQCIAFDPMEGLLWKSYITTDIVAYDREGNYTGRELTATRSLRKYGLAWYPSDPDSCFLHVLLASPIGNNDNIYRILRLNPATGDTLPGMIFPPISGSSYTALEITDEFNPLGGWSYLTVTNRQPNDGNDQVVVISLEPFGSWFEIIPTEGILRPEEEIECLLTVKAMNAHNEPLDSAHYRIDYAVDIEGDAAGRMIFPIDLYIGVQPPDFVPEETVEVPETIELRSIYPNPFNSSVTISFSTGSAARPTRLAVYGLDGRLVEDLSSRFTPTVSPPRLTAKQTADRGGSAVERSVVWNAESLPGGVYFVRLESGAVSRTMKAVLLK